ncbi:hypothetical protein [Paenarthrobacter nitroguajacolicus]|uniref:hypothetical protein n=1 Tax=Paenarthrobacter nitroguajacolicus TaxID=211146 RepID=UPI0015BF045B|nr:hypothetical protein [Paenarthrobacter nitroguajacolicus]NWL35184.1 hypothetical protein [Paenarthrobacter nitroguajacolicus]
MANKETLKSRANIAARFSALMRSPRFYDEARNIMPVDSHGEYSVIVADPTESAVVTIHRMEQLHEPALTLVTILNERVNVTFFRTHRKPEDNQHRVDAEPARDIVDVTGGMTVEDWLMAIDVFGSAKPFTVSGSEFAAELTAMTMTRT